MILKQRKVQDYKQQGYYLIRCKNYTVADTSMFTFFPLPCSGCGSCVYMVAVKDSMRQHAVQQYCMSMGCLWCFWESSWQSLDLNISPDQWLSELLPQVTYRLLWAAVALLRLAGLLLWAQREEPPLSHSWAVSMSEAGWVWISRDRKRTSCSPAPTLPFKQE